MPTLRAGRARSRGYTLLELLVVLFILGMSLAVLASAAGPRTPALKLRSGTSLVAAALRETRSVAIRDNAEAELIVDVEARTIQADYRSDEYKLESGLGLALFTAVPELQSRHRGSIRFFPDGTSSGGRIRLLSETQINDVAVNWLTGNVEVHLDVR